jgi:hypothetical protein
MPSKGVGMGSDGKGVDVYWRPAVAAEHCALGVWCVYFSLGGCEMW